MKLIREYAQKLWRWFRSRSTYGWSCFIPFPCTACDNSSENPRATAVFSPPFEFSARYLIPLPSGNGDLPARLRYQFPNHFSDWYEILATYSIVPELSNAINPASLSLKIVPRRYFWNSFYLNLINMGKYSNSYYDSHIWLTSLKFSI